MLHRLAIGLALVLLASVPAPAMHIVEPLDLAALTKKAKRIVVVTVFDRQSGTDRSGLAATIYRVRVERVLKGRVRRRIRLKQFGVGGLVRDAKGVVTAPIHGMPVYEPGHRYLLFLNATSPLGFTAPVGMELGTFAIDANGGTANGFANAGLFGPEARRPRGPMPLDELVAEARKLLGRRHGKLVRTSERRSADQRLKRLKPVADTRGNPLALRNGNYLRWDIPSAENTGSITEIPWDVETGPLGNASNADAIAGVNAGFAKWMAPSTTTVVVSTTPGSLGVDVDTNCPSSTCYLNWLNANGSGIFGDGLSPVIFDNDGSLTNILTGNPCGFGGLGGASGTTSDGGLTWTLEGVMVFDGAWLGGTCANATVAQFGLTFTHETGHFLGLGHSDVNGGYVMNNEAIGSYGVPPCASVEVMMSPTIPGCSRPNTLQKDDIASISQVYPDASFATSTATITGHVYQSDGTTGFNCGNVILRNDADPFYDAFGVISGIAGDSVPPAGQQGLYRAKGLTPLANYTVGVNEIVVPNAFLTNLCSPTPPTLPGPEDYYNGADESDDPSVDNPDCTEFVSVGAGATMSGVDIVFNTSPTSSAVCGSGGTTTTTSTTTTSSSSSTSTSTTSSTSTSSSTSSTTLPPLCSPSPVAGCQASVSQKGKLSIGDGTPDTKDKIGWKWAASVGTTRPDFGDPLNTTGFVLCVYDAGVKVLEGKLPAGGTCATKPCWQDKTTVIKYGDKDLTPEGIQKAVMKPGVALKGKIGVKGKGPLLIMPTLPVTGPVVVQLIRDDVSTPCWETTHTTLTVNDGLKLNAKSD
jgi:hypothetical protein